MKKRKFTDILCAIIFMAYLVLMVYISIHGFAKGDLDKIAQPFDSDGNPCGEGDFGDYHYLYINDPTSTDFSDNTVCVKKCPKSDTSTVDCKPNTDITDCSKINVYESYGFLSRICIPSAEELLENVRDNINLDYGEESV